MTSQIKQCHKELQSLMNKISAMEHALWSFIVVQHATTLLDSLVTSKYHHHDIDENSLLIDITLVMLESYWRHVVEDVVNGQM